jgi:hypothetical protein
MAVSASRARSVSQFFFLWCKLYFGPFSNNSISLQEKVMSVLGRSWGKRCGVLLGCLL